MSIKDKIMNIVAAHPKLVTFGIGIAITFVIGTAIGMVTITKHLLRTVAYMTEPHWESYQ